MNSNVAILISTIWLFATEHWIAGIISVAFLIILLVFQIGT